MAGNFEFGEDLTISTGRCEFIPILVHRIFALWKDNAAADPSEDPGLPPAPVRFFLPSNLAAWALTARKAERNCVVCWFKIRVKTRV